MPEVQLMKTPPGRVPLLQPTGSGIRGGDTRCWKAACFMLEGRLSPLCRKVSVQTWAWTNGTSPCTLVIFRYHSFYGVLELAMDYYCFSRNEHTAVSASSLVTTMSDSPSLPLTRAPSPALAFVHDRRDQLPACFSWGACPHRHRNSPPSLSSCRSLDESLPPSVRELETA